MFKSKIVSAKNPDFLSVGGEMAQLIRAFDWTKTPVGPIESWSAPLKQAVMTCLSSKLPVTFYIGPELIVIYNDAYIPIAGRKHPRELFGLPGEKARSETWHIIGPLLEQVVATGESIGKENLLLPIDRSGFPEEYYCTLSYIPIGTPGGEIEGILATLYNTTPHIIQERQLKTLDELGACSTQTKTLPEVCQLMAKTLQFNDADIPFALLYLLDTHCQRATLQGTTRVEAGTNISPAVIALDDAKSIWPLARVTQSKQLEVIDVSEWPSLPSGRWKVLPKQAALLPLMIAAGPASLLIGVFITGINPMRALELEGSYRYFYTLAASLISSALGNAQAYEKERQRVELLADLDRAKTEFFSNISHEFRTPLTLMLGPLEDMLADDKEPLTILQKTRLQMVQRSAFRLLKLTNSLLDFANIEAGRAQAAYEPTDLAKLTRDLSGMFQSVMEKAGLEFTLHIDPIDEPVYVDHDMWEKILFNLLSNAFKYTYQGGVTVSLKRKNQHIELCISDTGIGMSDSELPHIFERFYRVDRARGRNYEGTGIGLPLTQELVNHHGGTIQAISQPNRGTAFIVSLPLGKTHLPPDHIRSSALPSRQPGAAIGVTLMEEVLRSLSTEKEAKNELQFPQKAKVEVSLIEVKPESSSQPMAINPSNESKAKPKVLVADDNIDIRNYICDLLKPFYEVSAVADGEAALKAAIEQEPDLILSDIMMPKLGGLELIQALRQQPSAVACVPIILLSARAGEEMLINGLEQGADDYLVKPFSAKELLAHVKAHLKLGRIRIELKRSVCELKNVNAALKKSEADYRTLTSVSPVGIFHTNQEDQISYINPRGCNIIGLTAEEIQRGKWTCTLHPEDKDTVLQLADKMKKGAIQHFKAEYRYRHRDGTIIWVSSEGVAEKDSDGQHLGYIGTLTDITQLKLSEKARSDQAEKFRQRQEQFIDTLCHELRNPLTGIYGNVSLLVALLSELKKVLRSESMQAIDKSSVDQLISGLADAKQGVEEIDKCAKYQRIILDDVLNLSKLEAHKVELLPEDFSPRKTIEEAIEMLQVEVKRKNLHVTTKWSQPEIIVNSDPLRFKQVILNLFSNAIKFTPENGGITISMDPIEQSAERIILQCKVKDTGIGMVNEEKARLFDRFSQASRRTFQEYGGSGLGLAISKSLVELMGGKIEVESEKWRGTTFTFTMSCRPVLQAEKESKLEKDKSPELKPTAKVELSILIVEDNLINQKILSRLLSKGGYRCYTANNGKEAVEFFEKTPVDIIFMDIEMPIMNGLDATRAIREMEKKASWQRPPVPIIGLSGNASKESINQGLSSGMNDYMVKPYEKNRLYEKINEHTRLETSCESSCKHIEFH